MGESEVAKVLRLVFREVLPGDRRKFIAQSADSPSGGGARDFRFSPYDRFEDVFELMFPGRETKTRRRNGHDVDIEIYTGRVSIWGRGETLLPLEFEPPTSARPNEGRLTRLNHLGLVVPTEAGRVLLVLYETDDNRLWMAFATEESLQARQWHRVVNDFLLSCLERDRPANHAAQGFLDLVTGKQYCKSSGG